MSGQKIMRGRRGGVAGAAALVIVAAGTLGAIVAIQIGLHHRTTVFGRVTAVTHRLHATHWTNTGVLVTGIVVAALGAIVLLAGLLPAPRLLRPLHDDRPDTLVAIYPDGLRRDLAAVARDVDGIESARVKIKRRRVRVRARSAIRDREGLTEAVRAAVDARLTALSPVRPPRVRVRVTGSED